MDPRALFVLTLFVIGGAYALRGPFPALLVYLWLAYFRPDHWVGWSIFIRSIPMSYWVGVYLVASTLMSSAVKLTPRPQVWLILGFAFHVAISLALSPYADAESWMFYRNWAQSMVMTAILTLLVTDRVRFRTVLIVMALSISLDAGKQGWVGLIRQNSEININDIPFLGDNNHVAVGVLMMAGILGALVSSTPRRVLRLSFLFLLVGMLLRALQTHSRGGFLSIIALGLAGVFYSRRRLTYLVFATATALALFSVMPASFWGRMSTITPNAVGAIESQEQISEEDEESLDASAQSRVYFWQVARRMAADRPFVGVGYMLSPAAYDDYDPSNGAYGRRRAIHSAWFSALAETGFVGLLLLLSNLALAMIACSRVRRLAKHRPELAELATYAAGLNTAFFTYIVGASFVGMHYAEMFWHFVGLSICLAHIAQQEVAVSAAPAALPARVPDGSGAAAPLPAFSREAVTAGSSLNRFRRQRA